MTVRPNRYLSPPCDPWSHGLWANNKNYTSVAVPPAPLWVLNQLPLAPTVAAIMSLGKL